MFGRWPLAWAMPSEQGQSGVRYTRACFSRASRPWLREYAGLALTMVVLRRPMAVPSADQSRAMGACVDNPYRLGPHERGSAASPLAAASGDLKENVKRARKRAAHPARRHQNTPRIDDATPPVTFSAGEWSCDETTAVPRGLTVGLRPSCCRPYLPGCRAPQGRLRRCALSDQQPGCAPPAPGRK